jgi:formylglycine-generating enzyme required for sulfatase activity
MKICLISTLLITLLAGIAQSASLKCGPDSVKVGTTCVDKYEASAWSIPAANTSLVKKLQQGKSTLTDLTNGGGTQHGCTAAPFSLTDYPATFPVTGNWTDPVYAASVAGVLPSTCISWFQAEQACALSGKRLATNQEWQRAAARTPDPGGSDDLSTTCATSSPGPVLTGSRSACTSAWAAQDMVGNVWEWVGTWVDLATNCTNWPGAFGSDHSCVGGDGSLGFFPGGMKRGGYWASGAQAGVFAVEADSLPSSQSAIIGFRCAKP